MWLSAVGLSWTCLPVRVCVYLRWSRRHSRLSGRPGPCPVPEAGCFAKEAREEETHFDPTVMNGRCGLSPVTVNKKPVRGWLGTLCFVHLEQSDPGPRSPWASS